MASWRPAHSCKLHRAMSSRRCKVYFVADRRSTGWQPFPECGSCRADRPLECSSARRPSEIGQRGGFGISVGRHHVQILRAERSETNCGVVKTKRFPEISQYEGAIVSNHSERGDSLQASLHEQGLL